MIDRVIRPVSVAIDGSIVPAPGSSPRVGRAIGELDLYRDLAKISRSDAGIARAASRWGPLARSTPLLGLVAPMLGAYFGPIRDRLAADATDWAEDDSAVVPDRALFEAMTETTENLASGALEGLLAHLEMSEGDLAAMAAELGTVRSGASLGETLQATLDGFVRSRGDQHPAQGTVPRWTRELEAIDDPAAQIDRLAAALDALAAASDPTTTAHAMSRLQALAPPASEIPVLVDDEASNRILAPMFELLEGLGGTQASAVESAEPSDPTRLARRVVPALLAVWQDADTPGRRPPTDLVVPKLADPDTWRSALALGVSIAPPAIRSHGAFASLVHPERASEWRAFSIECALWRDAIDQLRVAEASESTSAMPGDLRAALVRLARQVGPSLGLPETDLAMVEEDETATIRALLLRWVTARCAIAGVEPRPHRGFVGTEGRALWSIHDALADATPARRCQWPEGCIGLLPPGAYAHRRYCDLHRREADRRRTAQRRSREQ